MKSLVLSNETKLLFGLICVKLLLHITTWSNYELHRDAYLYLAYADHLDWGYMAVPPFIAWVAKLALMLPVDPTIAARIFPALAGGISVLLIGRIVQMLGGKSWAMVIACGAFILSPAFLRSNSLFQPVTFNQFFWLLTCFYLIKLVKTNGTKYWIHIGVICGIGVLTKYSIAFLVIALLIGMLLTNKRTLLRSRHFGFALLIGFLIALPNLVWQIQHKLPLVMHMRELKETQLVHVNLADFLISQIFFHLPGVFVWLAGLIYLLGSKNGRPFRFLGYGYIILVVLLVALSGKSYYLLGIYPMLFAFGGIAIEAAFAQKWRFVKPLVVANMLVTMAPIFPFALPLLRHAELVDYARETRSLGFEGLLRWEDGTIHKLPQDFADMTGWKEVARIVRTAYEGLTPEQKTQTAVFANSYGEAGAIKLYNRSTGMPEPISFSASFRFWAPDTLAVTRLIVAGFETEAIRRRFEQSVLVGKIEDPYARESGLPVFLCENPLPGVGDFYIAQVRKMKAEFGY